MRSSERCFDASPILRAEPTLLLVRRRTSTPRQHLLRQPNRYIDLDGLREHPAPHLHRIVQLEHPTVEVDHPPAQPRKFHPNLSRQPRVVTALPIRAASSFE